MPRFSTFTEVLLKPERRNQNLTLQREKLTTDLIRPVLLSCSVLQPLFSQISCKVSNCDLIFCCTTPLLSPNLFLSFQKRKNVLKSCSTRWNPFLHMEFSSILSLRMTKPASQTNSLHQSQNCLLTSGLPLLAKTH